jgi:hypothetical protein
MSKKSTTMHQLGTWRDDGIDRNLFVSRAEARELGDALARGVTEHLWRILAFWVVLALVVGVINRSGTLLAATDATDSGPAQRSGMTLRTDYGTGCQYLSKDGVLAPRMTASGKQAGCRA